MGIILAFFIVVSPYVVRVYVMPVAALAVNPYGVTGYAGCSHTTPLTG